MSEPYFLSEEQVLEIHADQIRLFGGKEGILDSNLLGSAVAHPQHVYLYGDECSIFDLATEYAFSIGKNHAFIEGNKRTAIASAIAFLEVNDWNVNVELTDQMERLAKDAITKQEFSALLENGCTKKKTTVIDLVEALRRAIRGED